MPDFSEYLGLNSETVRDLADTYAGYAHYLASRDEKRSNALIASSFLIAGTYYSLHDKVEARNAFSLAAYHFQQDGNPFYKIAAICGLNRDLLFADNETSQSLQREEFGLSNLLTNTFLRAAEGSRFRYSAPEEIALLREQPVGRLGLPLGLYEAAFKELETLATGTDFRRIVAWPMLLYRATERTRLLQTDSYHWRSMKGNFLPVEPEILAASLSLSILLDSILVPIETLAETWRAEPNTILPLLIARNLLDNNSKINNEQAF